MHVDYLIVGGGIAGTSAADSIRQQAPSSTIIIVSEESYPLYGRLMLSKPGFVFNKIPLEAVFLKKVDWYANNKIQLLTGKSVISIDAQAQSVGLNDGAKIEYKKLLIASGLVPNKISVHGDSKSGIFYLRTLDDARNIINWMGQAKSAVCIGGGLIGFEMCNIFRLANLKTTLIIQEPYYWANLLCATAGKIVEKYLEKNDVSIICNDVVAEFLGNDDLATSIKTKNNQYIECDIAVVGIGARSSHDILKSAGIKTNRGVLADEYLQTNIPNIWTAGDCTEFYSVIHGEGIQLGNWTNAQLQGKIAGLNMVGKNEVFKQVSFYSTHGFGLNIVLIGDVVITSSKVAIARQKNDTSYEQFTIKDNKVVGAVLFNYQEDISVIVKLISERIDVSNNLKNLSNNEFDLKKLL